jgi:microcystin degradation protein MlrC
MRVAVGGLLFEGNTFALGLTTRTDFENNYLFAGQDIVARLTGGNVEVSGAIEVLNAAKIDIVPLIATHGGAGGRITKECFESLSADLLSRLRGQQVDGVFLALHGAMICQYIDDAESELLSAVRAEVGEVPIVITLDLHAHITPRLVSLCDAIVGYQHYPHDDAFETGVNGARLLVNALAKRVQLKMSYKKLAMLVPPTMGATKLNTPMRELFKASRAIESLPGILSVSYFPSTPWAERPEGGTAFVIVSDGEYEADRHLSSLSELLWRERSRLEPTVQTLEQVITECAQFDGRPIIVSEMSDAVGAGASGDSALVLSEVLQAGVTDPVLVQIVDPEVSALAHRAGKGATIRCEIGNKIENRFGGPVALIAEVLGLSNGEFTYSGGLMSGIRSTVGPAAILRQNNITVLVTSRSSYEYADEQYAAAGLNVRDYKFVIVKNPMNYRQSYSWAPRLYALDTPGAGRADLKKLPWTCCRRPFYPLDDAESPIYR